MTLRAVVLGLLALAAAGEARALASFCVNDAGSLRSAMASAVGIDDDVEIRIRPGNYSAAGMRFIASLHESHALTMSGGWGAGCIIQVRDPTLTVLEGEGLSQVLDIGTANGTAAARARFANFSVEGGAVTSSLAAGMSLRLQIGTPTVVVERMRFRSNHQTGGPGGGLRVFNFTPATVIIRNNLFAFNSASNGGGLAISSTNAGAVAHVVNNTVVFNQASGSNVAISAGGFYGDDTDTSAGSIELRNNAMFGNTVNGMPKDVHAAFDAGYVGIGNAYSIAPTGNATETGLRIVADPRFLSAQTDFRLASDSPLIDAGASLTPDDAAARDFDYHPRIAGKAPDIGAFESDYGVFADSFE